MTKEEYDKLPKEKQEMMQIGAGVLKQIINEMEDCVVGDSESALIFTCKNEKGETKYFNVTGYIKNSPQKHDV